MKTRDEYVAKLKSNLDAWNADVTKWEAQNHQAKDDMKKRYAKALEDVRARREEALYQLKLLQGASATAWSDLMKGTDEAWDRMKDSIAKARTHFDK